MTDTARAIAQRWSDDPELADAAQRGADAAPADAVAAWRAAQHAERLAYAAMTGALIAADQAGVPRRRIARETNLTPTTLYRALGQ